MSVFIKGMDMPKTCALCFLRDDFHDYCPYEKNKETDCPLVEVKTPHGKLKDADNLKVFGDLWEAPTVIEAEE